MRIAYLECFSGISGDMLLGALADAGAPQTELAAAPERLGLSGVTLTFERTERAHISACRVRVEDQQAARHHHRSLASIEKMIAAAKLPEQARGDAVSIFRRLGEIEARIHGIPVEKVHFHEVGAIDSIVDIVGSCLGFDLLGVDKIYCSPLNVGGGSVSTEHGILPVPAPATVDLLASVCAPVYSAGPSVELVTPTGAAVVTTLAAGFGAMPAMKILAAGYGAGAKDFPDRPNVLRILIGEELVTSRAEAAAAASSVCVIEANVDDMNPQLAGHLTERALAAGALDIYYTPVQMKKGRSGTVISLVVDPADRDRLARLLFEESSTIGVRIYRADRLTLERSHVAVDTDYGPIRIKVSREGARVLNFAPEYEDCRKAAQERGVPLKLVLAEANSRYLQKYGKDNR